jgi:hypothetical protein
MRRPEEVRTTLSQWFLADSVCDGFDRMELSVLTSRRHHGRACIEARDSPLPILSVFVNMPVQYLFDTVEVE